VEDGKVVDVFVSFILSADDLCALLSEILFCDVSDELFGETLLPIPRLK
jgi:hypothetical protein